MRNIMLVCLVVLAGLRGYAQPVLIQPGNGPANPWGGADAGGGEPASATVTVAFPKEVYPEMPLWATLTFPREAAGQQENLRYPFSAEPWFTWGHDFEVTFNGELLPRREQNLQTGPVMIIGLAGGSVAPAGAPKGRLPLHLYYRFDRPGTYHVRYVLRQASWYTPVRAQAAKVLLASEWVLLEVKPFSAEQRTAWQHQQLAHPPTDAGTLVGDYLPSLLASPDPAVLPVFLDMLYHENTLVQSYALHSLSYFGKDVLLRELPGLLRQRGPTALLAQVLSWQRDSFDPQGAELAEVILPYLRAKSALQAEGALTALGYLRGQYTWTKHPEMPERFDAAVLAAVPHLRDLKSPAVQHALALYLGNLRSAGAHDLLWQLAETSGEREQSLICLCWYADPRDLPRLGGLLVTADPAARSLPYHLRKAFGTAALPYLLDGMQQSPNAATRVECAIELAQANRIEAYRFFKDALEQRRPYKEAVVSRLSSYAGKSGRTTELDVAIYVEQRLKALGG